MARTQRGRIVLDMTSELSDALDLSTPVDRLAKTLQYLLTGGTAAGQANRLWHDRRTVGPGGESLALDGGLVDGLGQAFTVSAIKVLLVTAAAGNLDELVVTWAAGGLAARVAAGGVLLVVAAGAGYDVGSPASPIAVASGGAVTLTYEVVLVGVGA